jgi:hypothetical protein
VAALAARGLPVLDGATSGPLLVDGVTLVFVPGLPVTDQGRYHGLAAGEKGCGRTSAELAALVPPAPPFVVFAHEPPRQSGREATDLALGGVHAGEPALTPLALAATVFVHAGLDEAAGRVAELAPDRPSRRATSGTHLVAASGSIAAAPGPRLAGDLPGPSALEVEITGKNARVRSLTWPRPR